MVRKTLIPAVILRISWDLFGGFIVLWSKDHVCYPLIMSLLLILRIKLHFHLNKASVTLFIKYQCAVCMYECIIWGIKHHNIYYMYKILEKLTTLWVLLQQWEENAEPHALTSLISVSLHCDVAGFALDLAFCIGTALWLPGTCCRMDCSQWKTVRSSV